MRHLRTLLVAAALAAASATPAKADIGTILSGTFTGGTHFATTLSVSLEYCFGVEACPAAGTGIFYVGAFLSNDGSYGEVFKAIGLVNLPGGATVSGDTSPYANNPSGWSANTVNDLGGAGIPEATWAWIAPNPAPDNGLQPGQPGAFFFRVSNVTLEQVMALGVGVHAVSGPNNCSTKFAVWNGGNSTNDFGPEGYDPNCVTTTVPEPSTVILLGTGLLAVVGVARRRRRDSDLEV